MFKSHYNNALGKMIYTKDDYLKEMKRQGCEPYRPQERKSSKPYTPSKEAHEVVNAIKRARERDPNAPLPSKVREYLNNVNKPIPKEILKSKGGFYADQR